MSQDTPAAGQVLDLADPSLDDTDRAAIQLVGELADHPATPLPARNAVQLLQGAVVRNAQRHAQIMAALAELQTDVRNLTARVG